MQVSVRGCGRGVGLDIRFRSDGGLFLDGDRIVQRVGCILSGLGSFVCSIGSGLACAVQRVVDSVAGCFGGFVGGVSCALGGGFSFCRSILGRRFGGGAFAPSSPPAAWSTWPPPSGLIQNNSCGDPPVPVPFLHSNHV